MKRLLFIVGCLFLSSCTSNEIYYPIKISCLDLKTSKLEEYIVKGGIAITGQLCFVKRYPIAKFTDMEGHNITINFSTKRCSIAAYRE